MISDGSDIPTENLAHILYVGVGKSSGILYCIMACAVSVGDIGNRIAALSLILVWMVYSLFESAYASIGNLVGIYVWIQLGACLSIIDR